MLSGTHKTNFFNLQKPQIDFCLAHWAKQEGSYIAGHQTFPAGAISKQTAQQLHRGQCEWLFAAASAQWQAGDKEEKNN